MFVFGKPIRRVVAAAAMMAGFLSAHSARAEGFYILENSPNATTTINALMQPIAPFTAGVAETTSAITQFGQDNSAISQVEGNSNLSLIAQDGSRNRAVQAIVGNNSALMLLQGGTNNNVLQASVGDRNFQLVGVSGNNNSVAYVQYGSDLAGALDVTNAQNATVLALQTPQSGNYLMPVGLRGLQNAVVVIGPGRMYVFPKH
ncbi:hypothetical protein [Oricola sp.]|uniref:hypothetical protein n=1 Tax=Oricola sp. TaxID=1979950 RepID=UPI000C90E8F9|nr:hypothetical protein [Ahrensia sp.]MCK5747791.1 hypothetical protein [Oricola sp.]|tara:strand:- start:16305 stop:16913 length:609 start_codon:yes stop_codon:yes gene_type:complete